MNEPEPRGGYALLDGVPAWLLRGGMLAAAATLVVTVVISRHVLEGQASLVQGNLLARCCLPWQADVGQQHVNQLLSDPVFEMLPWLTLVRDAFGKVTLPLWNTYAQMGSPLLANDQSASFSPFTALALPFAPAVGYSIAMLVKLWVAGVGTALFLSRLGARGTAAAVGGIAFAGSSFMTVWLGWPHTSVAALMPWAFFGVEWFVQTRRLAAFSIVAGAISLQFLAGHSETSLHFGIALIIYAVIRLAWSWRNSPLTIAGLVGAAAIGVAMAGVQLLPFLHQLGETTVVTRRVNAGTGLGSLPLANLVTWLVPNSQGNPALDGLLGAPPNFNEGTGFATVTALLLLPLGARMLWRSGRRSAMVALVVLLGFAAGTVYGILTPIVGRLPLLSVSGNSRLLVVVCFVVAVLGGLGAEELLRGGLRLPVRLARVPLAVLAALALLALVVFDVYTFHRTWLADTTLPAFFHQTAFWLAAGLTVIIVLLLAALAATGATRLAAAGLVAVVLTEATSFVFPYNPESPVSVTPPPSTLAQWLGANQGDGYVAPIGSILYPEASGYYGVRDVRSNDLGVLTDRYRAFWNAADPGYSDPSFVTFLAKPDVRWLATAGVRYVLTAGTVPYPGTASVHQDEAVTVGLVPNPQPFAVLTASVTASGMSDALTTLSSDPSGPAVVEGGPGCCDISPAPDGRAQVTSIDQENVRITTDATRAATLVVHQEYADGWVARVDGAAVTIHPADVLFDGIELPPGPHAVTLSYEPSSVRDGIIVSASGGAVFAVVLITVPVWRRRRRSRASR